VGAGFGATTATLKGGLGSASARTADGHIVAALAAANAAGNAVVGDGPHFWAAPFEQASAFGGRGFPATLPPDALAIRSKGTPLTSTTLAVVATDAALTKSQAKRFAVMAQDGLARALYPVHTPLDGDVVFAVSTGARPLADPTLALSALGAIAANVLARAVARGVYEAKALPFPGTLPAWKDKFGQ
jgi:L-aminopeptidase/D-esterase-like protein